MLRVVNLSVGAHTLVASGRVDAVKISVTRRVKTLVDVHAFSAVARLPETLWTSTVIVTVRAGSTVLSTLLIVTSVVVVVVVIIVIIVVTRAVLIAVESKALVLLVFGLQLLWIHATSTGAVEFVLLRTHTPVTS